MFLEIHANDYDLVISVLSRSVPASSLSFFLSFFLFPTLQYSIQISTVNMFEFYFDEITANLCRVQIPQI